MQFSSLLISLTFFASGSAALIYQLVWQRYLFTAVGVDIDSVTLIVSSFMLGIGIGGAIGGWCADRWVKSRLYIYGLAELMLALFGVLSPWVFSGVQDLGGQGLSYSLVCFFAVLVVLIPTIVMGATLPLLTMYFDEVLKNVGVSVGKLYFFNTMGAAFGAWLAAWVLFDNFGLNDAARFAAVVNFVCFLCVILATRIGHIKLMMPMAEGDVK